MVAGAALTNCGSILLFGVGGAEGELGCGLGGLRCSLFAGGSVGRGGGFAGLLGAEALAVFFGGALGVEGEEAVGAEDAGRALVVLTDRWLYF